MEENNPTSTPNIVEIHPLKKGKRILLFFADYLISFIISFILINTLVSPIANVIVNSSEINEKIALEEKNRLEVLYDNNVLLYETKDSKYSYNSNLSFTLSSFMSYYSFNDDDVLQKKPTFGKKASNEVIKHYFVNIRNDSSGYESVFEKINKKYNYFLKNEDSSSYYLKSDIKEQVRLSFFQSEDVTDVGKTYVSNFENIFLGMYSSVMNDVVKNDLISGDKSYNASTKKIDELTLKFNNKVVICTFISYFISVLIVYLIFPLISKESHTPAMFFMKIEKIGVNNLYVLKKSETIINFFYQLIFNISMILLIPVTSVSDVASLFALPSIFAISMVGLLLLLVSLVVILISNMNRSVIDYLSRSVFITSEDLDNIYRAKGYYI